jgi:transposase
MNGIPAVYLLVEKGYESNAILDKAMSQGMIVVILLKRYRKMQRDYDQYLYRMRHLVEKAFLHLTRWCGIATRYAKTTAFFLAAVQI